jgi:TonB family protein
VLVHKVPVRAPTDACFGVSGTCSATVRFTVLLDGSVADLIIKESSRSRVCDRAIRLAVGKWRYAPGSRAVGVVEHVHGYTCPVPAANNSFQRTRYARR